MKRFYRQVTVRSEAGGWRVWLDERGLKTPAAAPQVVPTEALAEAMASEWREQGEEIDTSAFGFRDLADFALDTVTKDCGRIVEELLAYAETDTLCYRAPEGEALHRRQRAEWEPLLVAAEARYDVRFRRVAGIVHEPQPEETAKRLRSVLEAQGPFALAALTMMASLAASLVIALAALEPDAEADALFDAANLEEDFQAELWGADAEAETRRATRAAAFAMAQRFAALAHPDPGKA